jgi:hypothetical protein
MPAGGAPSPHHTATDSLENWPTQATDTVVDLVDQVRSKTTRPALTAARGAVFGLVLFVVGLLTITLFVIALLRGAQEILSYWVPLSRAVWMSYLIVGGLFTITGIVLWRMANRRYSAVIAQRPTVAEAAAAD